MHGTQKDNDQTDRRLSLTSPRWIAKGDNLPLAAVILPH